MIIEDEPLAVDVLVDYIRQVPALSLIATCADAFQAMEALRREPIDLIFLDIHLPGLKGLDFLETLTRPPKVILTTAYHKYALKGYDHNAVDYLLKPIEFRRFLQAVNKVIQPPADTGKSVIAIHSDKKTVLVQVDELLYVESQKEYVKFYTRSGSHVTKYALAKLEGEVDPNLFLRIHRSFIVAIDKITAFNNHVVEVAGIPLPVGGNYRDKVIQMLGLRFPIRESK